MVLIMQQKSRPSNRRGTGGQSGSEGRSMSCYHYEHTQSRERGYQPGQPLHRTVWFGVRTQAPTPNWHRICKCHTPGLDPWAGRTQDSHLRTALKAVVTKPAKINLPAAPILCQVILHRHLGKTAVPLSSSRTSTLHQSTFLFPGWDSVTSSTDGLWWE